MIKISNPIYLKPEYAYISLSDWNLNKEKGNEVEIKVFKDDRFMGKGIISKKNWIKTAKEKIKKVYYRPNEPMTFYYNFLKYEKPKTEDERLMEFSKQYL